jgi:hypothetical protein
MANAALRGATTQLEFVDLIGAIAVAIGQKPLDSRLEAWLNGEYSPQSSLFQRLACLLAEGVDEGWICRHKAEGVSFGRLIDPGGAAGRFSVDVVLMGAVAGPHHLHPNGEIGMIVPVSGEPNFDGFPKGWYVCGPGSDHFPTVAGGSAYVLYLPPDGAIEFTGRARR